MAELKKIQSSFDAISSLSHGVDTLMINCSCENVEKNI